jgi:hypothetical protein
MDHARLVPGGDLRLRRGAEHLNDCGARATAEFMLEFARAHNAEDDLLVRLDLWRDMLSPETLEAAGGDRFPPLLQLVRS